MTVLQTRRAMTIALFAAALVGCATPPRPAATAESGGPWSGRIALQVKEHAEQSFSALFELSGSAKTGQLTLSNPIGGTLAVLSWSPGAATLRSNGHTREFESVDALVQQATGSAIPVAALFDWLRGVATAVPGWKPDLSQLAQGRIMATRQEPQPEASLRVAIDR